jgi:hypothetical protein
MRVPTPKSWSSRSSEKKLFRAESGAYGVQLVVAGIQWVVEAAVG